MTQILSDPRWQDILSRNPAADFLYGVVSTGVFCRPDCPSRRPRPENVRLFDRAAAAQAAGFRPCQRCHPLGDPARALVTDACRVIEGAEDMPRLADLAAALRVEEAVLSRAFKRIMGLSPRAYAAQVRATRARDALGQGAGVVQAAFAAGYGSASRFYANAAPGMAPRQYRKGGAGEVLRFAIGQADLGAILVASSEKGVAAILMDDDPDALLRDLQDRFPHATLIGADGDYEALVAQVVGLVQSPRLGHGLPLDIRGTAFQRRVWEALMAIPPGQTRNYTQVAEAIGQPDAVRAVAGACAANALAVAIPCHRVVRLDGGLSGYRWGVARKQALLEREGAL